MSKHTEKEKIKSNIILKIIIVALFLTVTIFLLSWAGDNYIRNDIKNKTNLVINNNNITSSLKNNVLIQNEVIYLSKEDINNFFDNTITYDEKYNHIITTSESKVASLPVGEKQIQINSANVKIQEGVIKNENTYYIPISELGDVYNTSTDYSEEANIVTIDSLDRKYSIATMNKNVSVKYKPTTFSRTVAKVKKGEIITIANRSDFPVPDGWTRVRTEDGIIGYVKTNKIGEFNNIRDNMENQTKIEGTVSLVWDFYSQYVYAPERNEKISGINVISPAFFYANEDGSVKTNIDSQGEKYITWAHNNGYEIWPMLTNALLDKDDVSEIMRDYKLREKLINEIVDYIVTCNLDGINIDFENMYEEDKEYFSRFLIELEPKLNEIGAVLSVDVTAPDGAPNWSMCYDRYTIGKVADYIIFMAYDQYGMSSNEEGTTAGHDWVEANITKFLGQEGVAAEKLILGIPFYTMLWEEDGDSFEPNVVNMKSIDNVLPSNVKKQWDDELKQYYVEYTENGTKYKMWIEDEKSISAKLDLIEEYNLAGAAYWAKDRESSSVWSLISEKLGIN